MIEEVTSVEEADLDWGAFFQRLKEYAASAGVGILIGFALVVVIRER